MQACHCEGRNPEAISIANGNNESNGIGENGDNNAANDTNGISEINDSNEPNELNAINVFQSSRNPKF